MYILIRKVALLLYQCALRWRLPIVRVHQVENDLERLHPGKSRQELCAEYYVKKISLFLIIVLVGMLLGVAVIVQGEQDKVLQNGMVVRGAYMEEATELEVEAVSEKGERGLFSIVVEPRTLSEQEAEALYEEFADCLPDLISQGSSSLQEVSRNMVLTEVYADYPFYVEWKSSCPEIISASGRIAEVQEPTQVTLTATISYENELWQKEIEICVIPPVLSEEEMWKKEVEELLRASEEENRGSAEWVLPNTYGEEGIMWEQKRDNTGMLMMVGAVLIAVLVFLLSDKDLHDELLRKRNRLKAEYSDMVQKLALYLGAGLTIRGAFGKLSSEYEEIQYTCREMQAGISERDAYENFGKRVGVQEYLRLSTLLIQNLQKGNATLLQRLQEEAERASMEKMQNVRRQGEEATTKLLVPMVLFLVVVMIMIMLPAFSSMGG